MQLDPISTLFPIFTIPICGILINSPLQGAYPKPSPPITVPDCIKLLSPRIVFEILTLFPI